MRHFIQTIKTSTVKNSNLPTVTHQTTYVKKLEHKGTTTNLTIKQAGGQANSESNNQASRWAGKQ
jgi:hypothetical protein